MTLSNIRLPHLVLLAVALAFAGDLHAQASRRAAVREDSALAMRMRGFTRVVFRSELDSVAAYFPRAGDWTWLHARTGEHGKWVERWRFPGSDARRAIDEGGPLCYSFHNLVHAAPLGYWLVDAAGFPDEWRYAGRGRYVPTGAFADKPVFVEWQREGEEWVISAIGDHSYHAGPAPKEPRLLGYPLGLLIVRDTTLPLPDPPVDATVFDWYQRGALRYGHTYEMYGVPRPLEPELLRRYGFIGRVPVFRAAEDERDPPEVFYVLTGPQQTYQPFIDWSASEPCRS